MKKMVIRITLSARIDPWAYYFPTQNPVSKKRAAQRALGQAHIA